VITVVRAGPLTTVQDAGRPGYAHLGVPHSGALDIPAMRRANGLVGNAPDVAVLETTLMGCALRFEAATLVAVTGAEAVVRVDKQPVAFAGGFAAAFEVPAGGLLDVGRAQRGVRSYVAVAGGIDVEPVLGSRSTDTLSGLGPPKLADGMTLPIGDAAELSPPRHEASSPRPEASSPRHGSSSPRHEPSPPRHGPPPPGWVGPIEAATSDKNPWPSTAAALHVRR
jgi:allophanate hydrolase subunit 2